MLRLGATAIPLLCRELCGNDPGRRDAARDALEAIATRDPGARSRAIAALRAITDGDAADDAKVVALGLLSELGEHADVRFADPAAIRVRSAVALAQHLETPADVAGAADLMVQQLEPADMVQMLEAMADAAPGAAHRLAAELCARLDVAADVRDRVAAVAAALAPTPELIHQVVDEPPDVPPGIAAALDRRTGTHVAIVADATGQRVVIASRRMGAECRWRRWAVLIDGEGHIEECLHEDDAGLYGDAAALSDRLCAAGYRLTSSDVLAAVGVVTVAARATARATHALPAAYYLGRDLLGLGNAHLPYRSDGDPATAGLARVLALLAAGQPARAQAWVEAIAGAMVARGEPLTPDADAALAAALLAQDQAAAALAPLERALAVEPDWPLHHWNLAVAHHQLGDPAACHRALGRFVATSAAPTGLRGDPDQPARLATAERMIAELERAAWRAGHTRSAAPDDPPATAATAGASPGQPTGPRRPPRPVRTSARRKKRRSAST